jgi:asparagine synthase (glutamine-hydrolysing)
MCGIFGVFGDLPSIEAEESLWRSYSHRGPDSHGIWKRSPMLLGHCRLAILDLSPNGHQPMLSHGGRFTISYNGEIYNCAEIRSELTENHGQRFRGTSDTEVVLQAIETWGIEPTLQRIDGIFAFAVWDNAEKSLLLGRDRFGIKPLYFGWRAGRFFFASDARFVHALPGPSLHMSEAGLSTYLRYGYVVAPYSIYDGVYKLNAASFAVLKADALAHPHSYDELENSGAIRAYWSLSSVHPVAQLSREDAEQEFERRLSKAVSAQMLSDVLLGAFLSGGVDSSTIVALMAESSSDKIKTFSIGFSESRYNEAPYAREVARHLGTDHHELLCGSDTATQLVPELCEVYDEPFPGWRASTSRWFSPETGATSCLVVIRVTAGRAAFPRYSAQCRIPSDPR